MAPSKNNPIKKRDKRVMDLGEKIKILDLLAKGEKIANIARKFGINESTVRSIRDNEKKIRDSVKNLGAHSKTCKISRGQIIEKMEDMLIIWIQDLIHLKVPVSGEAIRHQAKIYYEHLKAKSIPQNEETFIASRGWFDRFKARFSLHNVSFSGESASADKTAARKFPEIIRNVINEKGYTTAQIFNCDETGLFWKKMPKRTYLTQEEKSASGFKAAKDRYVFYNHLSFKFFFMLTNLNFLDRYTLLLCANASGTFKCKPMLVYKYETPRALKGKRKEHLPVFWRSNKSAWVTKKNFEEWFLNSFIPEVKEFLLKENQAFKVLLLMDNAPSHSESLQFLHPNVEILFLPPNTTSLIQPMDQTIIATFKSYYLKKILTQMLTVMNQSLSLGVNNPENEIKKFWKNFTISDSIGLVEESWAEIRETTLNKSWRKLLPELVHELAPDPEVSEIVQDVIQIARGVGGEGFQDLHSDEISELVYPDNQGLAIEEIEEMLEPSAESDDTEETSETEEQTFTAKSIIKIIRSIQEGVDEAVEKDPIMSRSLKVRHDVNAAISCYQELYKDILRHAKQTKVTQFFKSTNE